METRTNQSTSAEAADVMAANQRFEQQCYDLAKAEVTRANGHASAYELLRAILRRAQEIKAERRGR